MINRIKKAISLFAILGGGLFSSICTLYYGTKISIMVFCLSIIIMTVFVSKKENKYKYIFVSVLLSLCSTWYYFGKFKLLYFEKLHAYFGYQLSDILYDISVVLLALFLIYIYCMVLEFTIPRIQSFVSGLDEVERKYWCAFTLIGVIIIVITYNVTTIFYNPIAKDGSWLYWDIVYTTDTPFIYRDETFVSIWSQNNDIRQPLFGLFSHILGLFCFVVSKVLENELLNAILLQCGQLMLVAVGNILITKMLDVREREKRTILLLLSLSYPVLLFSINIEQYVFAWFWTVLCIYAWYVNEKDIKWFYFASTGSILTSGVLFQVLCEKKESLIKNIKRLLIYALQFFGILVLFGRTDVIINAKSTMTQLIGFTGESVTFVNKVQQYTYFLRSCFVCPPVMKINWGTPMYWQQPVNKFSIIGIVIFIICLIGAIYIIKENKKVKPIVYWFVYSFVLLCIVGWGTAENGLVLYSLYFSWSVIVLFYYGIKKLLHGIINDCVIRVGIVVYGIVNISSLADIIYYGIVSYPR